MKKIISIFFICLLLSVNFINASEKKEKDNDDQMFARSNVEINYSHKSGYITSGINFEIALKELAGLKTLFNFGNLSITPTIGAMLLPVSYAKNNFDLTLIGGLFVGVCAEYTLGTEKQKILANYEKWLNAFDQRNTALKIGYKNYDIYGGAKVNFNEKCEINDYGIYFGFDNSIKKQNTLKSRKIAEFIVSLFNAGYDFYLHKDERTLREIKLGNLFYLFEDFDIKDMSPQDIWYIVEQINNKVGSTTGGINENIIIPTIQMLKKMYYLKIEYDDYSVSASDKIALREKITTEFSNYMWKIYDYLKSQKIEN
ncbi:MAG TPA: hypothetical protein PLM75_01450 [bacterium]|nr:hypothetical protein [bacterium]